jgi:hypothetical protein
MNFSRLMADVTELASQKKLPDKAVIGDLMRVINAVAIPGVNPMNPGKPAELGHCKRDKIQQRLRFHLDRIGGNNANKKAWSRLLSHPVTKQRVEFGASLSAWLTKDSDSTSRRAEDSSRNRRSNNV